MQWLIDIVKEWIVAQGYLTAGFVDRGDPAAWDYATVDFTKDNNWYKLDLSGIVPDGAKGVLVYCYIKATGLSEYMQLRKDGNTNTTNIAQFRPQLANVTCVGSDVCPISTDRKLEYLVTSANVTDLYLTVKGWWL